MTRRYAPETGQRSGGLDYIDYTFDDNYYAGITGTVNFSQPGDAWKPLPDGLLAVPTKRTAVFQVQLFMRLFGPAAARAMPGLGIGMPQTLLAQTTRHASHIPGKFFAMGDPAFRKLRDELQPAPVGLYPADAAARGRRQGTRSQRRADSTLDCEWIALVGCR